LIVDHYLAFNAIVYFASPNIAAREPTGRKGLSIASTWARHHEGVVGIAPRRSSTIFLEVQISCSNK